ncbi:hypothetical protein KCP74_11855 [Salmonella enterica subsp. enterica]|nr:hypothetical protein KCP74_11855 [Salmonella enterica subsp. enterica]
MIYIWIIFILCEFDVDRLAGNRKAANGEMGSAGAQVVEREQFPRKTQKLKNGAVLLFFAEVKKAKAESTATN